MSEPDVAMALVAVLLPPVPVPPLVSLVAPVVTLAVVVPFVVGVPLTGQLMLALPATEAGGVGVQVPTVTPGGRPLTVQVEATAAVVVKFVHSTVPLYGVPTVAVAGSPLRSGAMSVPVTVSVANAELLPPVPVPPLVSLVAPVVAVSEDDPTVVGVPVTGQEIVTPTAIGGLGEQAPTDSPAGNPLSAQVAFVAAAVGAVDALLVHLSVPL